MGRLKKLKKIRIHREGTHTLAGSLLLILTVNEMCIRDRIDRGELDAMPEVREVDAECCGQHEICERDSLLAAVSRNFLLYTS